MQKNPYKYDVIEINDQYFSHASIYSILNKKRKNRNKKKSTIYPNTCNF